MRLGVLLIISGLFAAASSVLTTEAMARPGLWQDQRVVIRGRAVCLDSSGGRRGGQDDCPDHSHGFGLIASDGKFYNFLQEDTSTAIFTDPRVRARDLQITARLHAGNRLEIIKVQSVRDGKLFDIFYFCEVCNITAYAPGPCTCCRQEFEFREVPATADKP